MAVEIDHDDIKTQIETILEANATLYDVTGANNKIRIIEVGPPKIGQGGEIIDTTLPHIWITNSPNSFETIRNTGVSSSPVSITRLVFGLSPPAEVISIPSTTFLIIRLISSASVMKSPKIP